MKNITPEILSLIKEIENDVHRKIKTPADFDFLAGVVWERRHENISPQTLKRLWGYIDGTDNTRRTTLCLLARFLGYNDWEEFVEKLNERNNEESSIFNSEGLRTEELTSGERVEVAWLPNRRCVFRYLGGIRFVVEENENSKLRVGDEFDAACFLIGHPMYLDNLVRGNNSPTSYVAGAKSGLVSAKVI